MFKLGVLSWQTKLIVIVGVYLIGLVTGWRIHGLKTDAGLARSIPEAIKTAQSVHKKNASIIEQKQKEIVRTEIVYKEIQKDIYEKNDQRICFADTTAWQLYNRSITGSDQHRPEHTRAAGRPEASEGEKSANQEIIATVTDVLTNSTENYETCRKNSVKHNALIDYVEGIKDKMCYCSD